MARRMQKYKSESNMHMQLAQYLRLQYPDVIFHTDFAAGIKMTMGQAVKNKQLQSGRGWPDLFIAYPREDYGTRSTYHGLFLELKKEGVRVLLANGEFSKEAHLQEQLAVLEQLSSLGYACRVVAGFAEAKFVVDQYMQYGILPSYVTIVGTTTPVQLKGGSIF